MRDYKTKTKHYPQQPGAPVVSNKVREPLIIQLNCHVKKEEYNKRLEELKEQYGGAVVLLRGTETCFNRQSDKKFSIQGVDLEVITEMTKNLINHIEKRRYRDGWDEKLLTEIREYQILKGIVKH